jgi:homogentisate 1,2-dioxygenase
VYVWRVLVLTGISDWNGELSFFSTIGTAFTAPRAKNQRTWLYRIRPSVADSQFEAYSHAGLSSGSNLIASPNQHRWMPEEFPESNDTDFVDGLTVISGAGTPGSMGLSIYTYMATKSMGRRAMYNSDGDMLIVPQAGVLRVKTEMGEESVYT